MRPNILSDLLTTLDVRLHAFGVCEIQNGHDLSFDAMQAVLVHYVLAGNGVLHQQGDAPVEFRPLSLLVVAPGRAHTLGAGPAARTTTSANDGLLLADGLLKFDAHRDGGELLTVCGTISATHGGGFGLFDYQTGPMTDDAARRPEVEAAFELLLRELADPRMGTRAFCEGLMKQCLILLLRDQLDRSEASTTLITALGDARLARAVAAILAAPGAPHTLESLSADASMSRSMFAERFFVLYGQTPFAFVATTRLRNAARLLLISDMPVKSIARSIGYASRSHFSRAFRVAFGQDPTAYRNARSANDELHPPMLRTPPAAA
jgi:AraC-like DNA-binding protein